MRRSSTSTLRIRIPNGFLEIAEEADDAGTFDASLATILKLLQRAARKKDAKQTHLLTVSLQAFLSYKGGNYALPTAKSAPPPASEAQADQLHQPRHQTEAGGIGFHTEGGGCLQSRN